MYPIAVYVNFCLFLPARRYA